MGFAGQESTVITASNSSASGNGERRVRLAAEQGALASTARLFLAAAVLVAMVDVPFLVIHATEGTLTWIDAYAATTLLIAAVYAAANGLSDAHHHERQQEYQQRDKQ